MGLSDVGRQGHCAELIDNFVKVSTSRNMRGAKRAKNENASKSLPVFAATLSVIPGPIKLHAATRSSSAS